MVVFLNVVGGIAGIAYCIYVFRFARTVKREFEIRSGKISHLQKTTVIYLTIMLGIQVLSALVR